MPKWLHNVLTDDANQYDIGFCWWSAGVVMFLVLAAINYGKFDAQQYGIGFGAVLAAGGMMSWLRDRIPRTPDQVVNAPNAQVVAQVQPQEQR